VLIDPKPPNEFGATPPLSRKDDHRRGQLPHHRRPGHRELRRDPLDRSSLTGHGLDQRFS
jgi:hypothetical protein